MRPFKGTQHERYRMNRNYGERETAEAEFELVDVTEEVVSAEYVARFCDAETREFFESIGGLETYHHYGDIHLSTSTSPDRLKRRTTVFTPIPEESGD